jgi:hypothetical protein
MIRGYSSGEVALEHAHDLPSAVAGGGALGGVQPVNSPLTPNRTPEPGPTNRPTRSSRRRRSPVENLDYAAFAIRIIRAHGRRIAQGDIEALPDLLDLAAELHAATQHAVPLRVHPCGAVGQRQPGSAAGIADVRRDRQSTELHKAGTPALAPIPPEASVLRS